MDGLKNKIEDLDLNIEEALYPEENAKKEENGEEMETLNLGNAEIEYEALFADDPNQPKENEKITYRKAEFETCDNPGDAIDSCALKTYLIISEDGKEVCKDKSDLAGKLQNPKNTGKNYFIFNEGEEAPFCVRAEKGGFKYSREPVSTKNQLGSKYIPKASLRLEDIVSPSYMSAEEDKLKDRIEELDAIGKNRKSRADYVKKFRDAEEAYNKSAHDEERLFVATRVGKRPEDICKKPEPPKESVPEFSTGRKVARALYKMITLGFGETDAYTNYRKEVDAYKKKNAAYFKELEEYKRETELLNDRIGKKQQKLHVERLRAEELVANISDKESLALEKAKIEDEIKQIRRGGTSEDYQEKQFLQEYHNRTEVIMEGVADIRNRGMITKDNIFAERWLLKNNLEGKTADGIGPEETRNLANYVVCTMAEKKAIDSHFTNPYFADGQQINRIIAGINNGSAIESMMKSKIFIDRLNELKAKGETKLNPDKFVKNIEIDMQKSIEDSKDPLTRLKEERQILEDKFGEQPITENVLQDVAKYRMVTSKIKWFEDKKNRGKEFTKQDRNSAKAIVNDLHSDIFSGYEKKRTDGKRVEVYNARNTDVRSVFADKTSRKALKNVITAEEAENGKNKVKYKLSEIAGRVDKEVVKIEAEMKAAKNAEAGKKGPAKG